MSLNCNGIKGDPGPQGIQGECGEQGIVGKDGQDGESFPKQGEAWLVDGMDTTKADYHFEGGIFIIVKKVDNDKFAVIINWLPNTEPDLAGYKIYYGRESGKYDFCIDAGITEHYEIKMLDSGEWFFTITAYDESRNESGYSEEVEMVN
uniref:Putative structural protein n=1 Tax=viral metagenome TaxID=1070528 RepID=A0A6M3LPJ4_9ZZZZ